MSAARAMTLSESTLVQPQAPSPVLYQVPYDEVSLCRSGGTEYRILTREERFSIGDARDAPTKAERARKATAKRAIIMNGWGR